MRYYLVQLNPTIHVVGYSNNKKVAVDAQMFGELHLNIKTVIIEHDKKLPVYVARK